MEVTCVVAVACSGVSAVATCDLEVAAAAFGRSRWQRQVLEAAAATGRVGAEGSGGPAGVWTRFFSTNL
jgi:hypothetical protein